MLIFAARGGSPAALPKKFLLPPPLLGNSSLGVLLMVFPAQTAHRCLPENCPKTQLMNNKNPGIVESTSLGQQRFNTFATKIIDWIFIVNINFRVAENSHKNATLAVNNAKLRSFGI